MYIRIFQKYCDFFFYIVFIWCKTLFAVVYFYSNLKLKFLWVYETLSWLDFCSFDNQSCHMKQICYKYQYFTHSIFLAYVGLNVTPHTHPHGLIWGFSPSLGNVGRPVLCWGSHSNSSRCSREVCVCVCLRERRRLALRWETKQTLQEKPRIWVFYDGTPVEYRQGRACVCMHVCVCVQWRVTCFMSTATCTLSTICMRRIWR